MSFIYFVITVEPDSVDFFYLTRTIITYNTSLPKCPEI